MSAARVTAAQLAGLPGMPADKSGVIRRAESAGWTFELVPGRGGQRREYHVEQLPAATRAALAWHESGAGVVAAGPVPPAIQERIANRAAGKTEAARVQLRSELERRAAEVRAVQSLRQAAEMPAADQARMDARMRIIKAYELFARSAGLTSSQAEVSFALAYNDGSIDLPPRVRAEVPKLSERSIRRWRSDLRKFGMTALGASYGNRAGAGRIDSQQPLADYVRAMLVDHPHARAPHVMQGLRARFCGPLAPVSVTLPSMRSLERWMSTWRESNKEVLLALANPDAWKNQYMVAFGSASEGIDELNKLWELDSSPADLLLKDGRYSLIAGIDVGTRWPRMVVSKTSRAVGVAALIRRMLLDLGVPERVKTDNGSDYKSQHITRVFDALSQPGQQIQDFCKPFSPWLKPHIERFFGTWSRDLVELAPGYIGHNVAERSAIEARKSFADRLMTRGETVELLMTAAELQEFCDQWVDTIYMHRPHDGLGDLTPLEAAARYTPHRRVIDDAHALDVLLAEAPGNGGRRTVTKKGIKLDDAWYIAPELEAFVGQEVQVRYDSVGHDLGTVFVFGGEALDFICRAYDPDATGIDRRDVAIKAKSMQTKRVQDERRALKAAAKKVGTREAAAEILRDNAARNGKLTVLQPRGTPHDSPGMLAAKKAADAIRSKPRTTADIEDMRSVLAAKARIEAEGTPTGTPNQLAEQRLARTGAPLTPIFENLAERVDWLLRQARVRKLGTEEADCLASFKRSQPTSYRRMASLVLQQLGPEAQAQGTSET